VSSLLPKGGRWTNELWDSFWDLVLRHIIVYSSRWLVSLLGTGFSVDAHLKLAEAKIR